MDSPYLGCVQYFAFNFVPKGYAACNGAQLSIQQNQALFSLFGTYYGGNGTTTFGLPDLRGRSIIGLSNGHSMGEKSGTPTVTIATSNMPMHTHSVNANFLANVATSGNVATPANSFFSGGVTASGRAAGTIQYSAPPSNGNMLNPTVTVSLAGTGTPINTMNPYIALNCCVATMGLYPSRN